MLGKFAGLASMATPAALSAGKYSYHAFQLLESGRGIVSSLILELRGGDSELEQHPKLN